MAGYGDDSGFAAWLADNGHSLPEGSLSSAVLRQRGSAYIDGVYGSRFPGVPTDGVAQERAWPRTGATAYGSEIASDTIPTAVVQASYAAALYEAENPGGLSAATSGAAAVKREKVGPLEVEYAASSGDVLADATIRLAVVEGLLSPLFRRPETAIFAV